MEGATDGVIVMTFGSMAGDLPGYMVRKFMNAFDSFDGKLRVVWRQENKANIRAESASLVCRLSPVSVSVLL